MRDPDESVFLLHTGEDTLPLHDRYLSRWYICFLFCIFCILQSAGWNFSAPIQAPLEQFYGWTDDFIEWLGNTANIVFCVLVLPLSAVVTRWGMRRALLVTVVSLCLNSGLRCIPLELVGRKAYSGLAMTSMVFNGLAGTVESLAPPVLSMLWFPLEERATATAFMATANTVGTAIGFAVAFVVPTNASNGALSSALTGVYLSFFGLSVATLISALIYFPDKPPTPPSTSSTIEKISVKSGIMQLVVNWQFWVVVASMALPLGCYSAWLNVLNLNLSHFHFSQHDAGWVGFGSALAGGVAGVLFGRVADRFPGRLTRIISILYAVSSLFALWFFLTCIEVLPFSYGAVYTSAILFGFCMYATYPLFFELAIEVTFPIPDACVSGFLVMSQSAVQAIFLALPVTKLGTKWMNYTLCIVPLVFSLVMVVFPVKYARLQVDIPDVNGEHHARLSRASHTDPTASLNS